MRRPRLRSRALVAVAALATAAACGDSERSASPTTTGATEEPTTSAAAPTTVVPGPTGAPSSSAGTTRAPGTTGAPATARAPGTTAAPAPAPTAPAPAGPVVARFSSAGTSFQVTDVVTGLDTVWALAWDPAGALWYTQRGGTVSRLGGPTITVAGVAESGEAGLMGLEIDGQGRKYVMYTSASDNRVVRLADDGGQTVLVSGIRRAAIHDGGRLRFGPDGALYASTGDAGQTSLSQDTGSLNGKLLRIDTNTGQSRAFSRGHRNIQGLCLAPDGRFLATEHGPDRGDEINVITDGFNGGWPDEVGNGIRNYTPTIAPGGCAVYSAGLIPAWQGSMLFVTLKDSNLHRLTFRGDGGVASDEVLLDGQFGRLRDVAVAPDGSVYLATSNKDGRGNPRPGDDRILRIAPSP